MRRRLPRLLLLLCFVGPAPGGCGALEEATGCSLPSGGSGAGPSEAEMAWALEVFDLVNQERVANGLQALAWDEDAARAAYLHSVDMQQRDFFDHVDPDGRTEAGRLTAQGVEWAAVGENLSMGPGRCTPRDMMDSLMASEVHRDNILWPHFTHLGVGVHAHSGGPWWTQLFYKELSFVTAR